MSYDDNAINSVYSLNNLPREAYHGNKGGQDRSKQPTPDVYAQTIIILKRKQNNEWSIMTKQQILYDDNAINSVYWLNNLPREAYHGNKGGQDRSKQPTPDVYAQTIII